jgi:HSP20 family protein
LTQTTSASRSVVRAWPSEARKKHETHREEHGFRYQERRYGAFARAIPLPCEVDADKAQANYDRGVLRITLPKTERAKAKRVKIQELT